MNDETAEIFTRLRPRLQGLAYRMLASLAEAEDVVQDAWLRINSLPTWREPACTARASAPP